MRALVLVATAFRRIFGLSCIWAYEHGVDCGLLREVENINLRRIETFVKKLRQAVWVLQGKQMAVLGLAFKGGTDDIRESPALRIIKMLLEEGARLRVHDPQAMEARQREMPPQAGRLEYCASPYEAARRRPCLAGPDALAGISRTGLGRVCMSRWKFQ